MAHYNPDQESSYYNPDYTPENSDIEYNLEQYDPPAQEALQTNGGISSIFKSMVGGMLVFGIGTMAMKKFSPKLLNSAVTNIAKNKGVIGKTFGKYKPLQQATKRILEKTPSKEIAGELKKVVNLRTVAEETPLVKQALSKYTKLAEPYTKSVQAYNIRTEGIKQKLLDKGKYNKLTLQKEKLKEFWKPNEDRLKRIVGTAEHFTADYLKTLPMFYAIDRVAFAGEEGRDKPSLLNIPGTALDFMKFGLEWLPSEIGFKGLGKAFQLGKIGVAGGISKAIEPFKKPINKFIDRVATKKSFNKLRSAGQHISAGTKAVSYINSEISNRFKSHFSGRPRDRALYHRKDRFFSTDTLSRMSKNAKSIYSSELKSIKSGRAKDFINLTLNTGKQDIKIRASKKDIFLREFTDFVNEQSSRRGNDIAPTNLGTLGHSFLERLKPKSKVGFFASILGRKSARRSDAPYELKQGYKNFWNAVEKSKMFKDGQTKQLKNAFYKSHYGQGVYKRTGSQTGFVDFSSWNPVNIIRQSLQEFKHVGIRVPFTKSRLTPYNMVMGDTLFGKGPKMRTFGKSENYRLSERIDTNSFLKHKGPNSYMVYSDGKFFMHDAADQSFHSLKGFENREYWLRPAGDKLKNQHARELILNQDREQLSKLRKEIGTPRKGMFSRWIGAFNRKQEFGSGFGETKSMFDHVRGFLEEKFFGKRSDIAQSYHMINNKKFLDDLANNRLGEGDVRYFTKHLMNVADSSAVNASRVAISPEFLQAIGKNSSVRINSKSHNFLDVLFNNTKLVDYLKQDITTAPKRVKEAISRYRYDKNSLGSIPKIGKPLNTIDNLRFEAVRKLLRTNAEGNIPAFGQETSRFMSKLAKKTGFSKIELSAVNYLGLSEELHALYKTRSWDIPKGTAAPFRDNPEKFLKSFKDKMNSYENVQLMKLTDYLTKMAGRQKADERLLSINKIFAEKMGETPFAAIEKNIGGIGGAAITHVGGRLASMAGFFGLGMDLTKYPGAKGITKFWGKRMLQFAGLTAAYNITDTFFDANPLFNKTMLDEGLTVAVAEQAAKARLATSKLMDITGITRGAQYIEGLMPGATTTIPGAIAGGFALGPLGVPVGALVNRMVGSYFNMDLTKSYEQLNDIYAGREKIPIRKGRFWELSKTPYEGGRISYYKPSNFHLLKSQYKNNPVLYGGKLESLLLTKPWTGLGFNPLGLLVDKYALERQQYFSRPYPLTAPAGKDMPLIGPAFSSTIGRILKPIKSMHPEELQQSYNGIQGGQWQEAILSQALTRRTTDINSSSAVALRGGYRKAVNPQDLYTSIGEQTYRFTEAAGLMGFLSESTFLRGGVGEAKPVLETAGRMSSLSRAYWDQELGGGLLTSEFFRRFVPRERSEIERRNPLKNLMPSWLPGGIGNNYFVNFKEGDAYCVSNRTLITYDGGLKNAEDIKINDLIYTHKGNWLPVKNIIKRKINNKEKCYKLSVYGIGNEFISEFSEEHPLYIYDNDYKFIPIKNCEKGQYLTYKIPKLRNNIYIECKWKKLINRYKSEYKNINEIIELDEDLSWVLGLYISEGSTAKSKKGIPHRLLFSMNKNEYDILEKINSIIECRFGKRGKIIFKSNESAELVICSTKIAQLFNNMIPGNLYNKRIPSFIFNSTRNNIWNLIEGMILGDGCISNNKLIYYTANKNLSIDFRRLSFSINIPSSITSRIKKDKRLINGKSIQYSNSFNLKHIIDFNVDKLFYKKKLLNYDYKEKYKTKNYGDGKYIYQKIKTITEIQLDYVYGFEVNEDNSFCVMDFATHNTKIPMGEARLPGLGYESLRNLKYTFPGRASMLGNDIPDQVAYMLGIGKETTISEENIMQEGTVMHKAIQNNLKQANLLIKDEAFVYDTRHDISGHVDAIIKDGIGGGGKRAVEIKTINSKGFDKLRAPKRGHVSQLNFYLSQLKMPVGNLVYVNRDDPSQVKSFNVNFSKNMLEKDMIQLEQARNLAGNLLRDGVRGQNIGNAYSHLDRLEILGDVAPYSKEYKSELKVVNAQRRAGLLTFSDDKKINTIKKHRANVMRRFDFYPRRFGLDQLMDPDAEYSQMNINENIKAAAEYSLPERTLGGVWEAFTHANLPLVNKFIGQKTALEHYQQNVMYGSQKSFWQKPYESFVEPAMRGMISQQSPIGGAVKFSMPGFLLGGPVGAIGAGAIGAVYGGVNGMIGGTYIPGGIKKQREIGGYFDQLEFEKNKRLHNLTGDEEYFDKMQQTMTGYKSGTGKRSLANLFRAVDRPEKDYLSSFLNTTNGSERDEILKLVPKDVGNVLRGKWGMGDNVERGFQMNDDFFKDHNLPDADWNGWSPHLPISDFKVQTMKMEGIDAHDVGLGWYEQERRIANSPWKIDPIKINETTDTSTDINQQQLDNMIQNVLRKFGTFGNISIIPINNGSDVINLSINASVDRRQEILKTLRGF